MKNGNLEHQAGKAAAQPSVPTMSEHTYAIVELMGHRQFGALVADLNAKPSMLVCGVLPPDGGPGITYVINAAQALYALTPCTELEAREFNRGLIINLGHRQLDFRPRNEVRADELCPDVGMKLGIGLFCNDTWGAFEGDNLIAVGAAFGGARDAYRARNGLSEEEVERAIREGSVKLEPICMAWARSTTDDGVGASVVGRHCTFRHFNDLPF